MRLLLVLACALVFAAPAAASSWDPLDDGGGGGIYPPCFSTCYIPNAFGFCWDAHCQQHHFAVCRWMPSYDGYIWSPIR